MRSRNKETTRQLILDTALDRFAEKGFDGASISLIAKTAKINQALIYYYFENKQSILDELINTFIDEANSYLIQIAVNGYEYGSKEMLTIMDHYNQHFMENDKILRLIVSESLKSDNPEPPIFKLIDFKSNDLDENSVTNLMNERGFKFDENASQKKVTEFFTGIMPMVVFSLLRHQWSSYFNLPVADIDKMFDIANEETHGQLHKK